MKTNRALGAVLAAAIGLGALSAQAKQLVVWHDLGDNGIKWFKELSALYEKEHPGVTIRSVSYPTDQWYGKAIAAINTNTAPDLIYNNYERVIRIQNQTSKIMDLKDLFASIKDKAFLSDGDLQVATYKGRMIILPIQRVQMAFGARKSWLEKVGEPFPKTWADVKRVAEKFKNDDPDGNGKADTFGLALEAAKQRDLIHMLDLFIFGSGLRHTVIDPDGKIVVDEPKHAAVLEEFLKTFTEYGYVAPDTINHSFAEMYQVIKGGRAGMFRVGDWNVKGWDAKDLMGDFVIGTWPEFEKGRKSAVVIGGMRGIAIPENSPNLDEAKSFAAFMLTKDAQQASLNNVGAAVRGDFPLEGLSERRMVFAKAQHNLNAYDFPESIHPFYPQLEAYYHKILLGAIANPPGDWQAFIKETADKLRAKAKELQ